MQTERRKKGKKDEEREGGTKREGGRERERGHAERQVTHSGDCSRAARLQTLARRAVRHGTSHQGTSVLLNAFSQLCSMSLLNSPQCIESCSTSLLNSSTRQVKDRVNPGEGWRGGGGLGVWGRDVGWLPNVPATCWCISGTDLLR